MVVVIASNGGVTKRVFTFDSEVDPGLVEWAGSYLNERLSGLGLGARMAASRLHDPELSPTENGFIAELEGAFTNLEESADDTLYVDGAARLALEALGRPAACRPPDAGPRAWVNVLRALRSALEQRSVFVWIGDENPEPELPLRERGRGELRPAQPRGGGDPSVRFGWITQPRSPASGADGRALRFFETVYDE